jgi:hypothetical protein
MPRTTGRGEQAEPLAVAQQHAGHVQACHFAAHAREVERSVDVDGATQVGIAHPRRHEQQHLALNVEGSGRHGR